eukprot:TRINITY_DN120362_c0_g1_i1.p2 TRINITY_DN120362_c0_g1~~TRINITY_DN120362_c0_g1_i1.p2  ORF type:complete len:322 (+),score=44.63 TRINITY_DN120362_c0_g1_i1:1234-2199(+)
MLPSKVMKSLTLNNGAFIPTIGLGTLCAKESLKEIIRSAVLEFGYRHIDTARDYENEEFVGEAIESMIKQGEVKREDLFITTKIFNHEKGKGQIETVLRDSLKKLRTPYVDLLLVHWPLGATDKATRKIAQTPLHETWAEYEECYHKGLCKSIGVSNFGVQLLLDLLSYCKVKPVVNQIEVHPYLTQEDLVKFCQEQGIAIEAYAPLGSPGTLDWRPHKEVVMEDKVIKELAGKYKKTPAQIALNWCLNRGCVVIVKTEKKARLGENMGAMDFSMEKEDYDKITALNKNIRYFDTKYWEFALNIPIFAQLDIITVYSQKWE